MDKTGGGAERIYIMYSFQYQLKKNKNNNLYLADQSQDSGFLKGKGAIRIIIKITFILYVCIRDGFYILNWIILFKIKYFFLWFYT